MSDTIQQNTVPATSPAQDSATAPSEAPAKRAIEEYFPIVEINRLAIPERNAFKPIYQMHKWFARRASCVFRAILLGALKPAGTDIMQEFYRDHTNDPETNGKIVLDPFMGGGTTVVEALRIRCRVIGIDLNPVAWFIVKTEVEPVDVGELEAAFERLASRFTSSGKTVREELLSHYKTQCPGCGSEHADIIYAFWVKSAICTNPECKKHVPLFPDYLIAQKKPSIRFHEARCPHDDCGKSFDWEIEPASMVGDAKLMLASALDGAGEGRSNKRWAFSVAGQPTTCPWCDRNIIPQAKTSKPQRKKVKLSVLYCPACSSVFQYRGTPPDPLACPVCSNSFGWELGNARKGGDFVCPHCGHTDAVIQSIRRLPGSELLPTHMYALEGHCPTCNGNAEGHEEDEEQQEFESVIASTRKSKPAIKNGAQTGLLWRNRGKFFKPIAPADLRRYQEASERWRNEKNALPYPKQSVPEGDKTKSGLIAHHYLYWHQLFNPRQLLSLSTLLNGILSEEQPKCREMLLMTFSACLDTNNMFTRFMASRKSAGGMTAQGVFARHDFQPKTTIAEQNVWGAEEGGIGNWRRRFDLAVSGKAYAADAWDVQYELENGKRKRIEVRTEQLRPTIAASMQELLTDSSASTCVLSLDSRALNGIADGALDHVITDPPYAGNVNYAELTDFYYVWLNAAIGREISYFAPDATPKTNEIIVNAARGKSFADFERDLGAAFAECRRALRDGGLLIFTYHHSDQKAWDALLRAVVNAGFEIEAVYPVQSEAETSTHLAGSTGISYDLIHVCRKRDQGLIRDRIAWATIRNQIRRAARNEIQRIEKGVYGQQRDLADSDRMIVLIGKCLQLYSRHYGAVVDHNFAAVPLGEALADIRMMVEQLVSHERPLPNELEDVDRPSYIWLTALSEKKEIKSDEVHKATRGIVEMDELLAAGLIKRGRVGRGRTFEVKTPAERYTSLLEKFGSESMPSPGLFGDAVVSRNGETLFIDRLHFLIALAEGKQDLRPWIERWKPEVPQFRAAAEYLMKRGRDELKPSLRKILGMLEVGPLGFE